MTATASMPVTKATAVEATVTAPKYPSGISVEKTLEWVKQWGTGGEKGGYREHVIYWKGVGGSTKLRQTHFFLSLSFMLYIPYKKVRLPSEVSLSKCYGPWGLKDGWLFIVMLHAEFKDRLLSRSCYCLLSQ